MANLDHYDRAFTHFLHLLNIGCGNLHTVSWDKSFDCSGPRTVVRVREDSDGLGYVQIHIAADAPHAIGVIGELLALMRIAHTKWGVTCLWSWNEVRLPMVDITFVPNEPGVEDEVDGLVRAAMAAQF